MQSALPLQPPAAFTRRDVLALIDEVGPALGLSAACLRVLRRMVAMTPNRDWQDPEGVPVFTGRQEDLADRVGVSPRQIRTHERALVRAGLADQSPLGNGHRSAAAKWGISFLPFRERVAELMALRAELRERHARKVGLKRERCIVRRRASDLLRNASQAELDRPEIARLAEAVVSWPRADRLLRMKPDALDHHVADAVRTVAALEDALGAPSTAAPDAPEEEAQPGAPRVRAVPTSESLASVEALTRPDALARLMEPDFRAAVLEHGAPTPESIMAAAEVRRMQIGVSRDCWGHAVVDLGRETATLALILVDAARTRSRNPVRNPSAYLRKLVQEHPKRKFNIAGGLIALERRRSGEADP